MLSIRLSALLAVSSLHLGGCAQSDAKEQCSYEGACSTIALSAIVDSGEPRRFPATAQRLLAWSPETLMSFVDVLRDVVVAPSAPDDGVTRFTYHDGSKVLAPLLAEPWLPPRADARAEVSSRELFDACGAGAALRYSYTGAAETGDGQLHPDVEPMLAAWAEGVRESRGSGLVAARGEARSSAWISTPRTGTSFHYDSAFNLVLQVHGAKMFELLPPSETVKLPLPPTGHPYYRQAIGAEPDHPRSLLFNLSSGDALVIPPLWAHQTASWEVGASISLNVWVDSALAGRQEGLTAFPLPLESSWPPPAFAGGVAAYLRSFLEAVGVPMRLVRARWRLVRLSAAAQAQAAATDFGDLSAACGSAAGAPEGVSAAGWARIGNRAGVAAALIVELPAEARTLLAVDYADDVVLGTVGAVAAQRFVEACLTG